jgi:hypothetical protein
MSDCGFPQSGRACRRRVDEVDGGHFELACAGELGAQAGGVAVTTANDCASGLVIGGVCSEPCVPGVTVCPTSISSCAEFNVTPPGNGGPQVMHFCRAP